ncbi:MAG TPA: hypothetical protein VKM55_19455 [Candidatus Lokiarchaeia archaeon]|nr:hypothetical protein [Candidatus Lokiarchaeia archaeon]
MMLKQKMVDMTIQVDDVLLERFKEACNTIGVSAIDYIELKVNEIIKNCMVEISGSPDIDDPRCRIDPEAI